MSIIITYKWFAEYIVMVMEIIVFKKVEGYATQKGCVPERLLP
jgi:hypothetical protein